MFADAATSPLFLDVQEHFADRSCTDVHFGWDMCAEPAHFFQQSYLPSQQAAWEGKCESVVLYCSYLDLGYWLFLYSGKVTVFSDHLFFHSSSSDSK